ncbi:uncharacterized protein LOC134270930 [Saccostrea cucullata]|uniref:uncharacterized protein LOC134270930 n=1 Tax=Saccostrea cuccullata TaxID=36930 RepID=UPI002ED0E67E
MRKHMSVDEHSMVAGMLEAGKTQRPVAERLYLSQSGINDYGTDIYRQPDSLKYRNDILHPIVRRTAYTLGEDFILMDDNARPHRVRIVNEYMEIRLTLPQIQRELQTALWGNGNRSLKLGRLMGSMASPSPSVSQATTENKNQKTSSITAGLPKSSLETTTISSGDTLSPPVSQPGTENQNQNASTVNGGLSSTTKPPTTSSDISGDKETTPQPITYPEFPAIIKPNVAIPFVLVINANLTLILSKHNDLEYLKNNISKTLTPKFKNTQGFISLQVTNLTEGSILADYKVILNASKGLAKTNNSINMALKAATTDWQNYTFFGEKVDTTKTEKRSVEIYNTNIDTILKDLICSCPFEYKCINKTCYHKCKSKEKNCVNRGYCFVSPEGEPKCSCQSNETNIFYGETCEKQILIPTKKSTTEGITPKSKTDDENIPLSKLTIIAISSGVGGGAVIILIIVVICICVRWSSEKSVKEDGSESESSSKIIEAMNKDNKMLENIPLDYGKVNPLFQEEKNEARMRYQPEPLRNDYTDQTNNLNSFPDRPRSESTEKYRQPMTNNYYSDVEDPYRRHSQSSLQYSHGSFYRGQNRTNDTDNQNGRSGDNYTSKDRYVYIEGKSGGRRLYKKVEDDVLGENTLIYQPSNMPRPIQRENVESVGDNFSLRPAPVYAESQRSTTYDKIDTDKPYKIQRPIIKHNNIYS